MTASTHHTRRAVAALMLALALVALDALLVCAGPRPSHSLLVKKLAPRLRDAPTRSALGEALRACARDWPTPRVESTTRRVREHADELIERSKGAS